ncbi:MAG: 50S ribosomal protein L15 [Alphaproteobacteria bacterium CG_4_9_14_3_um_filter_47_13]|nr:MAG: 50S ribosomal protein L15 [Alphaproteobacteria bacterium CG_4_9_14_3_um_filter_47_13]
MKLNELKPKDGSAKKKIRVGRGIGSGKGKTSGKGQKGQKSRSGVAIKGFEGGQMPLHMRMPKRGFNNPFARQLVTVSLARLQEAIDTKKIDPKAVIDEDMLVQAKVIRRKRDGVRLLGNGDLKTKIDMKLTGGATKSAISAVEKAGGKIEIVEPSKKVAKAKSEKAAVKKEVKKPAAKKKATIKKADA